MKQSYLSITWDTEDLISCKQAVYILYFREGVSEAELYKLNFGNLDIEDVLDENF